MINIYSFLINLLFPFYLIIIYFRTIINKEDKKRFKEKFISPEKLRGSNNKEKIWFHASSLGEVTSVLNIIKNLNKKYPDYEILITTVTLSSGKMIEKFALENKFVTHYYFPYDKKKIINNFLNFYNPKIVMFVDSEIWPNFIFEINKRKIPLILLNARITQKTNLRCNKISKFSKILFQKFDLFIAASEESRQNLKNFNINNVKFFGNLKYSANYKTVKLQDNLINILEKSKPWIAASTHEDEEKFCLKAHLLIKFRVKNLITIIAPRHLTRIKKIENYCKNLNIKYEIYDGKNNLKDNFEVLLINSFGLLNGLYKQCNSVFMGKSIIEKFKFSGGQNPIEAAKEGCKIYHGKYVYNFKDVYNFLNGLNISKLIVNEQDLSEKIIENSQNKSFAFNDRVKKLDNIGNDILQKTISEISKYLDK